MRSGTCWSYTNVIRNSDFKKTHHPSLAACQVPAILFAISTELGGIVTVNTFEVDCVALARSYNPMIRTDGSQSYPGSQTVLRLVLSYIIDLHICYISQIFQFCTYYGSFRGHRGRSIQPKTVQVYPDQMKSDMPDQEEVDEQTRNMSI